MTTQLLGQSLSSVSQESLTLWSDHLWPAAGRGQVRDFLSEVVPTTTARLQISKGIIDDIPTPTPQYVRLRPRVPVLSFQKQILERIRVTAAYSAMFAISSEEKTDDDKEFRRLLARIVEQYGDDQHWENFMSRALSLHADKKFEDAAELYCKAKTCIQNDPHVRDKPNWILIIRDIEEHEDGARQGQTLDEVAANTQPGT